MDARAIPLKTTGMRFIRTVVAFARSESGGKAKLIFAALVLLLCVANALNVVNSFVGRNFMSAIAEHNMAGFMRQAILYVGVFAALTVVAVIARFGEERLGLLWRDSMTRAIVRRYLQDGNYQRLKLSGVVANPDQRISEDVRAFTVTTLSFTLMALNSAFTIVAFSEVLWTISPLPFGVAMLYAAGGSLFTFWLGRPLIRLNYDQLDKEASFRSGLIHVRDNADAIIGTRDEDSQRGVLLTRLDDLVANFRRITSVNRNVGFFTTGFNWMIQIIPALIIAPAFIEGRIEFGVITQSAMAFTTLVALREATKHAPPLPETNPEDPGPFAFADDARVRRILSSAGFADTAVTSQDLDLDIAIGRGLDAAVAGAMGIGPTSRILDGQPEAVRAAAAAGIRKALAERAQGDSVPLGAAIWMVTAVNPGG